MTLWRHCVHKSSSPFFFRSLHHRPSVIFAPHGQAQVKARRDDEDDESSRLGLRSNHPPDMQPEPNGGNRHLSDQDWEIRTGELPSPTAQPFPANLAAQDARYTFFSARFQTFSTEGSQLRSTSPPGLRRLPQPTSLG